MLDEHADEPLYRTVERAVDHHRALMHVVLVRVLEAEAFRKIEVHLDRGDLPVAADRVPHVDVDLRSVERAVAFVHGEIDVGAPQRFGDRLLREVPQLVGADRFLRSRREPHAIGAHAHGRVQGAEELDHAEQLVHDLLGAAEDVRVVLREAARPQEAVQRARSLVAIHRSELRQTDRKITVRAGARAIDQDVERAVHRLGDVLAAVLGFHRGEHVLAVVTEMPAHLPQRGATDVRGEDRLISELQVHLARQVLERLADERTLRVPQRQPRADLVGPRIEVELPAEPPVIAALRFLQHVEMLLERFLRLPRGAVDALQHRVVLVAAPVGPGDAHQLERRDEPCVLDVRAEAQVLPAVVAEDADGFAAAFGCFDAFDDLDLERLIRESFQPFVARQRLVLELLLLGDDLPHLRVDRVEIFGRERAADVEVVIEAVLDRRPDRVLRAGEQRAHGLGHDVRGRMSQHVTSFGRRRIDRAAVGQRDLRHYPNSFRIFWAHARSSASNPTPKAARHAWSR